MVNASQLETLAIGESIVVDGIKVTAAQSKTGKRIYQHENFSSRSAKAALAWVRWAKKMDKRMGVK